MGAVIISRLNRVFFFRAVVGDLFCSVKNGHIFESHHLQREGSGKRHKRAQGGRTEHALPVNILSLVLLSSVGIPKVCPDGLEYHRLFGSPTVF